MRYSVKENKITSSTNMGILVGVAPYSAVKNGWSFFTFLPFILAYLFVKGTNKNKT